MTYMRPAILATALLLALGLSACTPEGPGDADTAAETTGTVAVTDPATDAPTEAVTEAPTEPETTAPQEMTMEPKTTMAVIAEGKTAYTIVAPTDEAVAAEVAYMTRVMQARFGAAPAVAESAAGKAIRVEYTDGDSGLDWRVVVDEESGDIRIQSGGTEGLCRAIRYFITDYLAASEGDLLVDVAADYTYTYATDKLDNSGLLSYEGGDKTVLMEGGNGEARTPAWLNTAVMVELRIDIADIGGTFAQSYDLIDHYAEAGVNVLWLSPIYKRGSGNGYGNFGLHTIEPALTGTEDEEAGWNELKAFVDYAHSKGVYILLDLITWGTTFDSPIYLEHGDWFSGEAWGGGAFNWRNREMKDWFVSNAVALIERTGADGFRCDCEPFTAGYKVFEEIRRELNKKEIYPLIMSEEGGQRRQIFDCEQDGVLKYAAMTRGELYQNPVSFFVDGYLDIVDTTKTGLGLGAPDMSDNPAKAGLFRYYTNCITNHDYQDRIIEGNRLKIGYAAIYAPYIPLWFMGDEIGQTLPGRGVLYFQPVTYEAIGQDAGQTFFFEDVKEMIAIRRTYDDVFNYWPLNHRESNICEVKAEGLTSLQNYARYSADRAVIVLANNDAACDGVAKVSIPFAEMFGEVSETQNFRVTDLASGRVITVGYAGTVDNFDVIVPFETCGVYLVEKVG